MVSALGLLLEDPECNRWKIANEFSPGVEIPFWEGIFASAFTKIVVFFSVICFNYVEIVSKL